MIVQEALKIRWLKVLICIMLCITSTTLTFFIQYQEVCAILPAIIPIGIGILAGAALLTACGLTFYNDGQARGTATDLINKANQFIAGNPGNPISFALIHDFNAWNDPAHDAALNIVGDLTWEFVKDYLSNRYTGVTPVDDGTGNMVYVAETTKPEVLYSDSLGANVFWSSELNDSDEDLMLHAWTYYGYDSAIIGTKHCEFEMISGVPPKTSWRYKVTDTSTGLVYDSSVKECVDGTTPRFIFRATSDEILIRMIYKSSNNGWTYGENVCYRAPGGYAYDVKSYDSGLLEKMQAITAGLSYDLYGDADAVNNPAHETYVGEDGKRVIYVPQGATTATYVNNSYTNIYNETADAVAGGATIEEDPDTWWDVVGSGITNGIYQLGQLLVGTLAQLKAAVEALAAPIVSAISNAVAAVQEKIAEGQQSIDPQMSGFKFFDLFIIFFDVLIACIALVARACLYLATIVTIPADGSIFNDATLSGLNFFKNQNIPVVNVSMWNMFSGLMTLVISLSVVKKVRSTHT